LIGTLCARLSIHRPPFGRPNPVEVIIVPQSCDKSRQTSRSDLPIFQQLRVTNATKPIVDARWLAERARREAPIIVLRRMADRMSLAQLTEVLAGRHGPKLRSLTVGLLALDEPMPWPGPPGTRVELLAEVRRWVAGVPRGQPIHSRQLRSKFKIPRWTAQVVLAELVEIGVLERRGRGGSTHYVRPPSLS
jgi:hypothetical protein